MPPLEPWLNVFQLCYWLLEKCVERRESRGPTGWGEESLHSMRNKFAPSFAHFCGCVRHPVESDHTRKWDHQQVVHRQTPIPLCLVGASPPRSRLVCCSSSRFNSSTKASNFCGSCSFMMASQRCFQGVSVKFASLLLCPKLQQMVFAFALPG